MMDIHALKVLEFEAVREMLASQACSLPGKKLSAMLSPSTDLFEVNRSLEVTDQMRQLLRSAGDAPLEGLKDIDLHLDRSMLEGAILSANELKEVREVLVVAGRMSSYFKPHSLSFPFLQEYFSSIIPQPHLEERIGDCIGEEGEILDGASLRLKRLRHDAFVVREKIRDKLQGILLSPLYQKVVVDSLITIRNDRYVIPVRPTFRTALRGFIQDQSASGQTLFVEPLSLVDDNNRLKRLRLEEEEEIRRILQDLTIELKKKLPEIRQGVSAMARLDLLSAKARLAEKMRAQKPSLRRNGSLRLFQARHPLLIRKMESKGEGRTDPEGVVPIDILVGDSYRVLVITGPNMGGKTVALKTAGLLSLMALAGLHIPASADSELPCFSQIFADIGEEQDIEQNLSTFSSHISQIAKILQKADPHSLVLLDELGSGTDPQEGSALGIAILEELYQRGAIVLATTHQDSIKAYAYSHRGMEDASVEFDLDTLRPRYKLNIGLPGQSYALDIAQQLGIGGEVIGSARGLLRSEIVDWESMVRQIREDRLLTEENKRRAQDEVYEATQAREESERLLQEAREKKKGIDEEGRRRIESFLAEARRQIESVIREIRTREASRDSIKGAQQVLSDLTHQTSFDEMEREEENARPLEMRLSGGEKVRIKGLRQEGYLLGEANGQGLVEVQIRVGKIQVPVGEIEPASGMKGSAGDPITLHWYESAGIDSIRAELNLIGKRREEAITAAEKYLDDAALAGLKEVRLIHGKGAGILRRGIEEMLRDHPMVEEFHLASFHEGGAGATIVKMKS
jgi:DNA mismatch repair protein MutS2